MIFTTSKRQNDQKAYLGRAWQRANPNRLEKGKELHNFGSNSMLSREKGVKTLFLYNCTTNVRQNSQK